MQTSDLKKEETSPNPSRLKPVSYALALEHKIILAVKIWFWEVIYKSKREEQSQRLRRAIGFDRQLNGQEVNYVK